MSMRTDPSPTGSGGDPISRAVTAIVGRIVEVVPALKPLQKVAETIARFAGVGGVSSVLYAVVTVVSVSALHLHHDVAALMGFAVAMPFNFILHRRFTFRSVGMVQSDLQRYAVMQGVNVLLSLGTMALSVDGFGLPYAFGIFGAIVLIPFVTYFVMDRWVFQQKLV